MTMRSYDDVDFRPWYLPDTARWLKLSLGARGLVAELVRKLDRHGRIALGADPAADLAVILRIDEGDARRALTELIDAERLVWDAEARVLMDPDLPARLRQGSATRMANKRARDAAAKAAEAPPDVAPSHASLPVTSRHARHSPSPSDLISSDLLEGSEEPDPARARPEPLPSVADPTSAAPEWWDGVLATIHASVGVLLASGECWLAYAGHRHGKRRPPTREDALQWLVQVMVPKARKTAQEARERRDRETKWDAERKAAQTPAAAPYHAKAKSSDGPTPDELAETQRLAKAVGGKLFAFPPPKPTGTE